MLEDIRDHSPRPRQQEIEWMGARPLRAIARVIALAAIATATGNALVQVQQPEALAAVAYAGATP